MLGDFSLNRAADREVGVAELVIGAARLFQINQAAGAFSSLGMILNALMTPISISLAHCVDLEAGDVRDWRVS